MIIIARGIVTVNDRTLLKENEGTIELGNQWCKSIAKQIDFAKHKATTTKPIIAPGLISEIGHTFHHSINVLRSTNVSLSHILKLERKS